MNKRYIHQFSLLVVCLLSLYGCSEATPWDGQDMDLERVINVGVEASGLTVSSDVTPVASTRAVGETTDAEKVSWLIQPLKSGLDITYGKVSDKTTERVAILKLLGGTLTDAVYETDPVSGYAKYSFCYRADNGQETTDPARWYDNGPHYFEGVHVPTRIRFTNDASELESNRTDFNGVANVAKVTDLTSNQSGDVETGTDNDLGNYTLLSHYLGMPANTRISATVERIKLPFRHRLAHVLAYIIIDPTLKSTIKGYTPTVRDEAGKITQDDDPNTSSIKFCNVDVLKGVKDEFNSATQLHTLTPVWAEKVRKVTPHFWGEIPSLVVYESDKETIYPKSSKYEEVEAHPSGYTKKTYENVPVYDLIVRPTYTSVDNVMYDEEGYDNETSRAALAAKENQIDFLITLDNGLVYEKTFVFDLDANYETIVYLHITREGVDYNESGAEQWQETSRNDNWYGVDNKNGNNLSEAGSSWQRAYTRRKDSYINDGGDKVTDGGYYDEGTTGEDDATGQYLSAKTWIKYFSEAYEGGAHHGDYFNLSLDIEIDARLLPDEFVFTGHLDAFGDDDKKYHTITLTHTGEAWKEYVETTDYSLSFLYTEKPAEDFPTTVTTPYTLPTLYRKTADAVMYTADNCVQIGELWYDQDDVEPSQEDQSQYVPQEGAQPVDTGSVKTPAVYEEAQITLAQLMAGTETFFTRSGTEGAYSYIEYQRPERFYRIVERQSASALFAGLNGIYTTAQEQNSNYAGVWEANVHQETNTTTGNTYWLPWTGWRAEVMNLTVKGAKLFQDGAVITGNVQNCQDGASGTDKVPDHVPALPQY